MSSSYRCLVCFSLITWLPHVAEAQRMRFGVAVGGSLVAGNDFRRVVSFGGFPVTGANRAGYHLRGIGEVSFAQHAFRVEIFYNQLSSSPNSWVGRGNDGGMAALSDRTMGVTTNLVGSFTSSKTIRPYFLLGAGPFISTLGTNPDRQSDQVVSDRTGLGIGIQAGLGLRVRAGTRDALVEWRFSQALNETRGVAFLPVTLGVVF